MSPAWHAVRQVALSARTIASSLSALNAAFAVKPNGALGAIKVGTWPNEHFELLEWDSTARSGAGAWIGEQAEVVTQSDTWAMDLRDKTGAQLTAYAPITEAVPYGGPMAILSGSHDLSAAAFTGGTGVVSVGAKAGHAIDFAGAPDTLRIRDNYISYTGISGAQTSPFTFTGCTRTSGSGGTVPSGVIVSQGRPGGFGFVVSPVPFAGELWAAGLRLQEKLFAHLNASAEIVEGKQLTIAPYWYNFNAGDGSIAATAPPSGGLAFGNALTGPVTPGGLVVGERQFYLTENDWADAPLTSVTKRYLIPQMCGKMAASAIGTGQVLDAVLRTRWIG
jgi:hypothetical protein